MNFTRAHVGEQLVVEYFLNVFCLITQKKQPQVMWALETLNGPRLIASLVQPANESPTLPKNFSGRWRAEVTLERPPFAHTITSVLLPVAAVAADGGEKREWALLMLSLKDGRPPLFSVVVVDGAAHGKLKESHEAPGAGGGAAGRAKLKESREAPGAGGGAAGRAGCWYSTAAAGRFLHGCDGDKSGDGSVLLVGGDANESYVERCGMVHSELSAAIAACNFRETCGGVTLVPGWGFELRSSTTLGE